MKIDKNPWSLWEENDTKKKNDESIYFKPHVTVYVYPIYQYLVLI